MPGTPEISLLLTEIIQHRSDCCKSMRISIANNPREQWNYITSKLEQLETFYVTDLNVFLKKGLRSSDQIFIEIISMALARASMFKSHLFPHLNE